MACYSGNGEEIHQFQLRKYDTTGSSMEKGWSICENVNDDHCTSFPFRSEVKVCDKSGNMRFFL
jgi:hypothetical protein